MYWPKHSHSVNCGCKVGFREELWRPTHCLYLHCFLKWSVLCHVCLWPDLQSCRRVQIVGRCFSDVSLCFLQVSCLVLCGVWWSRWSSSLALLCGASPSQSGQEVPKRWVQRQLNSFKETVCLYLSQHVVLSDCLLIFHWTRVHLWAGMRITVFSCLRLCCFLGG